MATAAPKPVPLLNGKQVLQMTPAQRAAYLQTLVPAQRSSVIISLRTAQARLNRIYMINTIRQRAVAPQASGGALTQTYSPGTVLTFGVPSAQNAFCEGVWIRAVLTVTLAAGTAAVYAKNAAAPLSVFDNIQVLYNGVQHNFRPYILSHLNRMSGRLRSAIPYTVLAGQTVTTNDSYRNTGQPVTAGAGNSWTFEFFVPFNLMGPNDARGLLPTMSGETQLQVAVTCAPSANVMGNDPILNVLSVTSGSGHTIAVTGTVACYAQYRDGQSLDRNALLGLDISGLATTQLVRDTVLTGLTNATTYRQKVNIVGRMPWYLLTVIDGNQSNKFSANSNIAVIELNKDSAGQNSFIKYGTGTNMSPYEFWLDLYMKFGQDIDEGILPIMTGPISGVNDIDDYSGTQALVVGKGGWNDFVYGVQLTSVSGLAGITPRVETHAVLLNKPLVPLS